jgi:hypothetical protein
MTRLFGLSVMTPEMGITTTLSLALPVQCHFLQGIGGIGEQGDARCRAAREQYCNQDR